MIQINDSDLPIMVAEKIINGVKPYNPTACMKALAKALTGDENSSNTQDMFDIEEIKEIADYLMVYYQSHQNGD
jgi:hypothetical protein